MNIFEFEFIENYKKENLNYLIYEDENIILNACFCSIGKIHPFIEKVSATMWYPLNDSGIYINGYDKINDMDFLPLFNIKP